MPTGDHRQTESGRGSAPAIEAVIEQAPAKINLALHVTGRRDDGYHRLESVVTFANFVDRVRVSPSDRDIFKIVGAGAASLAADGSNLVERARDRLRAFAERIGVDTPAVAIRLEKNLPVAAGLGGGSADAAATLRGLARLWAISTTPAELAELGIAIGADVPMCLSSRPLTARGIGDVVAPLAPFPTFDMVLVNPGLAVSTRDVFKALDGRWKPAAPSPHRWGDARDAIAALATMRNDLQETAVALCPPIGDALAALRAEGALLARMSGSGATCFGIFPRADAAARAAGAIRRRHPAWLATDCRTFYGVTGGSS